MHFIHTLVYAVTNNDQQLTLVNHLKFAFGC